MKYTEEDFYTLLKRSYCFNPAAWQTDDGYLLRFLYWRNYLEEAYSSAPSMRNIPKKIHQIWLGSELPEKYKKLTKSWQKFHPDWEYKLWTDKDAQDLTIANRQAYDTAVNYGMKSDILRYEILRQQGGLYVDTDFECLKSFDDLMYLEFFAGIAYSVDILIYCGLIASVPHHPVITKCADSLHILYDGNEANTIMYLTGPDYLTRCFLSTVKQDDKGIVAFPCDFFYPLPNNERGGNKTRKYIRPCSYAIHHFGVSWC